MNTLISQPTIATYEFQWERANRSTYMVGEGVLDKVSRPGLVEAGSSTAEIGIPFFRTVMIREEYKGGRAGLNLGFDVQDTVEESSCYVDERHLVNKTNEMDVL
ncbi:hypothetical protein Tco_0570380 [Tanacetum coccineum]